MFAFSDHCIWETVCAYLYVGRIDTIDPPNVVGNILRDWECVASFPHQLDARNHFWRTADK